MTYPLNRSQNLPPIFRNLHQILQNLLSVQNLESGFFDVFSMGCEALSRFRKLLSEICSKICFSSIKSITCSRFQISDFPTLKGVCPPLRLGHTTDLFLVLMPMRDPIQPEPP